MPTPRFCESCGAELVRGARFCEACGAPLQEPAAAAADPRPQTPAPAARLPAAQPGAPARGRGPALLLALAVLAGGPRRRHGAGAAQPRPEPAVPASPAVVAEAPPVKRAPATPAVSRADIERLKAAVASANRAHVAAILAGPGDHPELRIRLNDNIVALGRGLYRHHVANGSGDLAAARAEMRSFLQGLEQDGLGLSEPVIDEGVASVAP
ncbi:MAG: zinc ribbon domain-containing protein [Rhodanobacteraceae bacterium]|nr:zinc ribbon domain-containing protein [Rhodanobacteraceae bacterium]